MNSNDIGERTGSRVEVVDAVGTAFDCGPLSKSDLVSAAEMVNSSDDVVSVLRRLPDGIYRRPADMWTALPDVPIEH